MGAPKEVWVLVGSGGTLLHARLTEAAMRSNGAGARIVKLLRQVKP